VPGPVALGVRIILTLRGRRRAGHLCGLHRRIGPVEPACAARTNPEQVGCAAIALGRGRELASSSDRPGFPLQRLRTGERVRLPHQRRMGCLDRGASPLPRQGVRDHLQAAVSRRRFRVWAGDNVVERSGDRKSGNAIVPRAGDSPVPVSGKPSRWHPDRSPMDGRCRCRPASRARRCSVGRALERPPRNGGAVALSAREAVSAGGLSIRRDGVHR
jgi:hypothetical protein